jgi:hypothetical protein
LHSVNIASDQSSYSDKASQLPGADPTKLFSIFLFVKVFYNARKNICCLSQQLIFLLPCTIVLIALAPNYQCRRKKFYQTGP